MLNSQSEQRFSDVVSGAANSVNADLDRAFTEIAALEAFVRTEPELSNAKFASFASTLGQRTEGSESLGFAPRVSRSESAQFILHMQAQGIELENFSSTASPNERFPVAYMFPPIDGLIEPGGNIEFDSRFRAAVQDALNSRSPTASGPITLRTNPSAQPWFVLFQPVFGDPEAGRLPSEGPLLGYVFSVYRVADFLAGPLDRNNLSDLPFQVFDSSSGRQPELVFPELDPDADPSLASSWVQTSVDFAGRRWDLQFETPDQFGLSTLERNVWVIILAAGLGLTVFASVSMFSLLRARSAAHSDLDLMTSQIRVIVGSAIEGIVVLDRNNRLLLANRSFADAFGLPDPDVLTHRDWSAVRESTPVQFEDRDSFFETLARLSASQQRAIVSEDVHIRAPVAKTLSMSSSPINDGSGEYIGRLFVFRDVTVERSAEEAKSDFVSMVSHELRTPLTSIVGYVDLLTEGAAGEQSPEAKRLLDVVSRNGNRLASLVSDILDLSRIDSARFDLEPTQVNIANLIDEVTESLAEDYRSKNQTLNIEAQNDIPEILVDRLRISQVITNLVSNAHRYTPEGGKVTIRAFSDSENLTISVNDTGLGISSEDQPRVFERFAKINRNGSRPPGSTGLGLAITKALVELHGGTISLKSAPGKGSEFTVQIPFKYSAESAA